MLREEGAVEIRTERSAVGRRGNPKIIILFSVQQEAIRGLGCGVIHLVYVLKDHCICGTEKRLEGSNLVSVVVQGGIEFTFVLQRLQLTLVLSLG